MMKYFYAIAAGVFTQVTLHGHVGWSSGAVVFFLGAIDEIVKSNPPRVKNVKIPARTK